MPCLDENQISGLIHRALPPAELEAAHAHLANCNPCRGLVAELMRLESGVGAASTTVGRASSADGLAPALQSPLPSKGTMVGRYMVLDLLGAGGMGAVFAAYDPELDRKVALKLLHASGASSALLVREAQAAAKLSHPAVVIVHDVGIASSGQAFVAMELVEGGTLREWLRRESRTWREVLDVFVRAGQGLAAAHSIGLVHRDFKPDNVLVGTDGRIRVTDFGLARAAELPGTDGALSTKPGSAETPGPPLVTRGLFGTPAYMSPEQLRGGAPDAISDQFSFCCALYEALFGTRPFAGDTAEDLRDAISSQRLVPPRHEANVPAWVRRAVLRGLSAAPLQRHASMASLLDTLGRGRRKRPLLAGALTTAAVVGAVAIVMASRAPNLVCTGASSQMSAVWNSAAKAALAAALPDSQLHARTGALLDRYAAQWVQAHTAACEDTRVLGQQSEATLDLRIECLATRRRAFSALVGVLSEADVTTAVKAPEAVTALPSIDACADVTWLRASTHATPVTEEQRAGVDPELQLARARFLAGRYVAGLEAARRAGEVARAMKSRLLEAEALLVAGRISRISHDFVSAEKELTEAALAAYGSGADALAAEAWIELIDVVGFHGARPEEGFRLAAQATEALRRLGGNDVLAAKLEDRRGSVYGAQRNDAEARRCFEKSLSLAERVAGKDDPSLIDPLRHLGGALWLLGDDHAARVHLERAFALATGAFGADHPVTANVLGTLASVLAAQGDLEGALAADRTYLESVERSYGARSARVIGPLMSLTADLMDLGRADEAAEVAARAVSVGRETLPPDHPSLSAALSNHGVALRSTGRLGQALPLLREGLKILDRRNEGSSLGYEANALASLGDALIEAGEFAEALRLHTRARQLQLKAVGPQHEDLAESALSFATLHGKRGEWARAEAEATEAERILRATLGPDHPKLARALISMGEARLRRGRVQDAVAALNEAVRIGNARAGDPADLRRAEMLLTLARAR